MNRAAVGSFAALRMRRTSCGYSARASKINRGPRTVHRTGWGGFQRGRAPFVSSRKRGSRGRNPIERVSPSVRVFGYFLHEQKVTRVWAGEAQEPPNKMAPIREKNVSPPLARRHANLSASVPFAGTGEAKRAWGRRPHGQNHFRKSRTTCSIPSRSATPSNRGAFPFKAARRLGAGTPETS